MWTVIEMKCVETVRVQLGMIGFIASFILRKVVSPVQSAIVTVNQ